MNLRTAASLSALALCASTVAFAGPVPYPVAGSPAPVMVLTATSTDIKVYFVNANAGDTDSVRLFDLTSGYTSAYFFDNKTAKSGDMVDFGQVTKGDQLVFELFDSSTGTVLRSDAKNPDGIAHAYITHVNDGQVVTGSPRGLYAGFEDRISPPSDLDYNDDNFIFTNVAATAATPEPGSLALLGTGALGAFGVLRRKLSRS